MKSRIRTLLCLLLVPVLLAGTAGCRKKAAASSDTLPTVLNQGEYVLYQNIFFNGQGSQYVGQKDVKEGTFVMLDDRWNGVTRYYVWGYMDATKCCDWQWEFVPEDPDSLPAPGSLVRMTGVLEHNEAALDKYWYTGATVEVRTVYTGGGDWDVDMCTMDGTLERVQLLNLIHDSEHMEGCTVRLYGRVMSTNAIQHPYYDNAWTLKFSTQQEVPAIGTLVLISGTWRSGVLVNATLTPTSDY